MLRRTRVGVDGDIAGAEAKFFQAGEFFTNRFLMWLDACGLMRLGSRLFHSSELSSMVLHPTYWIQNAL